MSRSPLFGRLSRLLASARTTSEVANSESTRQGIDRRSLLASTGMGLWAAGCSGADPEPIPSPPMERVAVIGAGIAGLHCAYRLQQAGFAEVVVYEARDNVGGRMFTGRDLFLDGQSCELGGELIDSNHATMWSLAEELGILLDDRWANEPAGFVRDTWDFDGTSIDDDVLLEQLTHVAGLFDAAVLAADTDDDAYEQLDAVSLSDWLDANVPKAEFPELHVVLNVAYRGEFGLECDQQSALNLIYLMGTDTQSFKIFGESDERWHAHLGNDRFPVELAQRLASGTVVLGTALVACVQSDQTYRLTLRRSDGTTFDDQVGHVVYALPFSVLRDVDLTGAGLPNRKLELIQTLGYGTNVKVMAGMQRAVWREDHLSAGSLTTDRPVQQTWDSSIGQAGSSAILTNFLGGDQGVASSPIDADRWVRDVVLADLEAVYPGTAAAYTGIAVKMDWPTVPTHKGSYTCYRPGQWATWGLEGRREGFSHFCGEHCSLDFQGWMEGAAETGMLVAAEILDDHGIPAARSHRQLLDIKLQLPQASYHGGQPVRLSMSARRKVLVGLWMQRRSAV